MLLEVMTRYERMKIIIFNSGMSSNNSCTYICTYIPSALLPKGMHLQQRTHTIYSYESHDMTAWHSLKLNREHNDWHNFIGRNLQKKTYECCREAFYKPHLWVFTRTLCVCLHSERVDLTVLSICTKTYCTRQKVLYTWQVHQCYELINI